MSDERWDGYRVVDVTTGALEYRVRDDRMVEASTGRLAFRIRDERIVDAASGALHFRIRGGVSGRPRAGTLTTMPDRVMPPMNADEYTTLAGWLEFYRATLVGKCDGLDEEQLRTASVPPSSLTLLGLLQHAAEVERNWFRRVLTGEDVPSISGAPKNAEGHDGGFELREGVTFADALAEWDKEVAVARTNCEGRRDLDRTSTFAGGEVTLRWIYAHMIAEYARHIGHADLLRERIDGCTGF